MRARETTDPPVKSGFRSASHPGGEWTRALRIHLRSLHERKAREECNEFILEGGRLVQDALEHDRSLLCAVVEDAQRERWTALLARCAQAGVPVFTAPGRDFAHVSDTVHSQGILAVARRTRPELGEVLAKHPEDRVLTYLWEVSDPGNLGTVVRTCDWFGQGVVLLSKGSVDPTNPKTVRSTMGSILRVTTIETGDFSDVVHLARLHGYRIAAARADGNISVTDPRCGGKLLIVFGNESHGLPQDILRQADLTVRIPRKGKAESLNLAIAHGIFLSHLCGPME